MEISGTSRALPGSPDWNAGFANSALVPPPAPSWKPKISGGITGDECVEIGFASRVRLLLHPVWNAIVLSGFNARLVPPISVAKGELAGKSLSLILLRIDSS